MRPRANFPILLGFSLLSLSFFASCERGENEATPEEVSEYRDLGEKASDALMKSLGGQLKSALQAGGPVEALRICQQAAIPLTEAAGGQWDGVRISRKTLQPRNPANAPDESDRAVLVRMADQAKAGENPPSPVLEWKEGKAIFYRPLMIQEVCLNCHGAEEQLSPELNQVLAEKYPNDEATGYSLGDFRGVIRVKMDQTPR